MIDLFDLPAILYGYLRAFDTHFDAVVLPFPYVGETSRGDWVFANFDEATSNDVRRWQDPVVAADGLQLV